MKTDARGLASDEFMIYRYAVLNHDCDLGCIRQKLRNRFHNNL